MKRVRPTQAKTEITRVGRLDAVQWFVRHNRDLKPLEVRCYLVYCCYVNDETGLAWPSVRTVAEKIHCPTLSRVRAAIRGLVNHGFLDVEQQGQSGRGHSNRYWVAPFGMSREALDEAPGRLEGEREKGAKRARKRGRSAAEKGASSEQNGSAARPQNRQRQRRKKDKKQIEDDFRASGAERPLAASVSSVSRRLRKLGLSSKEVKRAIDRHDLDCLTSVVKNVVRAEDQGRIRKSPLALLRHLLKNPEHLIDVDSDKSDRTSSPRRVRIKKRRSHTRSASDDPMVAEAFLARQSEALRTAIEVGQMRDRLDAIINED